MSSKVLVVMSGGLDSTTLAYELQSRGWEVSAISFNYGQRHGEAELDCASWHAEQNNWNHRVVDMSFLAEGLKSSLTGHSEVPEGHYAAENMKATIVPNRNAIMMSLACGYAVAQEIPFIATAVHGGDHFIYPDCRVEFIASMGNTLALGNEGFDGIIAPYVHEDKNYIAQRAVDLGYDYNRTWSCYKGGTRHCGRCGTCVERMEALWSTTAGTDIDTGDITQLRLEYLFPSTLYADNTYWMNVLKGAKQ